MSKNINDLIAKQRERIANLREQNKKSDKEMDALLNKIIPKERFDHEEETEQNDWDFEHDDFECGKCKEGTLNLYLGTHNGEDAQRYECTNCDFVEIKTYSELSRGEN